MEHLNYYIKNDNMINELKNDKKTRAKFGRLFQRYCHALLSIKSMETDLATKEYFVQLLTKETLINLDKIYTKHHSYLRLVVFTRKNEFMNKLYQECLPKGKRLNKHQAANIKRFISRKHNIKGAR